MIFKILKPHHPRCKHALNVRDKKRLSSWIITDEVFLLDAMGRKPLGLARKWAKFKCDFCGAVAIFRLDEIEIVVEAISRGRGYPEFAEEWRKAQWQDRETEDSAYAKQYGAKAQLKIKNVHHTANGIESITKDAESKTDAPSQQGL